MLGGDQPREFHLCLFIDGSTFVTILEVFAVHGRKPSVIVTVDRSVAVWADRNEIVKSRVALLDACTRAKREKVVNIQDSLSPRVRFRGLQRTEVANRRRAVGEEVLAQPSIPFDCYVRLLYSVTFPEATLKHIVNDCSWIIENSACAPVREERRQSTYLRFPIPFAGADYRLQIFKYFSRIIRMQ